MLVRRRRFTTLVLFVGLVSLTGCGRSGGRERTPAEERLYKIGMAYLKSCHVLGRAPDNFGEIKGNIEGPISEDLLVSPNDGAPFVILWGVDVTELRFSRQKLYYVLGYEKMGANGTRLVLRYPIALVQMTDEDLQKAAYPPGHKPPS
jgi:hypothetical protein